MTKVTAYYMGRRITTKNRLGFFWLFEAGDERGYQKQLSPASIGEQWSFHTTDKGSVIVSGPNWPERITGGECISEDKLTAWNASDIAAYQCDVVRKAQKRLANRPSDFEKALIPIRRILDAAKYHEDRALIINRIVTELWRRP